jgi:uroporphyrinogen decarboxylase
MTHKEKFIAALKRRPIEGRVPTFELVFYLTMEAFGKVHPSHRLYSQWSQMSRNERELQLRDMADCYILAAESYEHSAIFVHPNPDEIDETTRLLEIIREKTGDTYFIMMHGDSTPSIPGGDSMMEFTTELYENPQAVKDRTKRRTEAMLERALTLKNRGGLFDGFALCADYCFNTNPFYSPEMFDEFVTPDLKELIAGYRELGFMSIKHTDGNIMPILEQMVSCEPDALHSLDPQGGVDLAEVKRLVGDRVALCGNVNCGLLQTGTDEECRADIMRCLRDGMNGWGFIFCTSNCAYTGLPLGRYEMMIEIWREHGNYK